MITFMECFDWGHTSETGDPWSDRGYTRQDSSHTTSKTLGRPGSNNCCAVFVSAQNNGNVITPYRITPVVSYGMAVGHIGLPNFGNPRIYVGFTSANINVAYDGITYNLGGNSGFFPINLNTKFAYVEISITPTLIVLRVDNAEVARQAGSGFTGGTGLLTWVLGRGAPAGAGQVRVADVYMSDDGLFRGDTYVRRMPITAVVDNTGELIGGGTVPEALRVFHSDKYIKYDMPAEKTLLELEDIPDNPSNIHGVQLRFSTRKTETDNVTAIPYVTVNGVEEELITHQPGPGAAARTVVMTEDPVNLGPWTKANVNVLRAGMKRE